MKNKKLILKFKYRFLLLFYRMRFFFIINISVKSIIRLFESQTLVNYINSLSCLSLLVIIILLTPTTNKKLRLLYINMYKQIIM